jgi:endonuclease YncB( thermonuclease family)
MTPATRLLVFASVVVVAGAGAAAFVLTSKPSPPAQMAPPAPAAPPAAPAQPAQAVQPAPQAEQPALLPAAGTQAAALPTTQFTASVQNYSLIRDSAAYSAASLDAPQFYPLRAGTGVVSAAKSNDGQWVVAMTQDGQAACIPAADLGPYDPQKVPMLANIDGPAEVIDTATLNVNGQRVPLAGVVGQTGAFATGLQEAIDSKGSTVSCTLSGSAYVCTFPDGADIARTSLFNGAAAAAPDASADYKAQEQAARDAQRGMWK